ncbi:MAG: CRISPR-associated protein Cas6 [Sulfurovum sp.]|nr:MAG: CRISPR-associated protein Cas6 [Sulfurovum sp.]
MKQFELTCVAYLKRDITFKESFEILSKYISFSMCQDRLLLSQHTSNIFNNYNFGGFYPIEKDKTYKRGNSYSFTIRSVDEDFIDLMSNLLRLNINNPNLQILTTTKKIIHQNFITELYSATPVIVTVPMEDKKALYWTMEQSGDIMLLQKQLHDNMEKKYNYFCNQKIKPIQNFIQLIEIKNTNPQTIQITKNGKTVRLFGNKFKIVPNEDEVSQKLAFLSLGVGLGEKNSFGGGFMMSKGTRG